VLDAYCPHLGAHLGKGGRIESDTIVCPFHAWRFDGCGQCVDVPYAKKIPPKARVRSWPVKEMSGVILVWYHGADAAPSWEPPVVPEYGAEDWTPYERRRWTIRTRHQEMAENAVDTAHFHFLHGTTNHPESQAEIVGPLLHVTSTTGMSTPRGGVDGSVESKSWGFGFSTVRFRGIVETLLVSSSTSIDEETLDVRFAFSVRRHPDKDVTKGVGKAFIREVTRQLEQDIPIWENKVHWEHPVLCDGDGPIGVFRKWCRQFYSAPAASEPAGGRAIEGGA
jgi:phenylpropionate dioxygenase-like ring-hydroxylating dioxygenase large terminal subunit